VITYCTAEFISDQGGPTLTCDKPDRPHLIHHDPTTGVRYMRYLGRIFDLCGIFRHRETCPLDTGLLNGITGPGKNLTAERIAAKAIAEGKAIQLIDGK
jgi:hypothetical protein